MTTPTNYRIAGEDQNGRPVRIDVPEKATFYVATPQRGDVDEWGVRRPPAQGVAVSGGGKTRPRANGSDRPNLATDHRAVVSGEPGASPGADMRALAFSNAPIPKDVLLSAMDDPTIGEVVKDRVNIDLAQDLADEAEELEPYWPDSTSARDKLDAMAEGWAQRHGVATPSIVLARAQREAVDLAEGRATMDDVDWRAVASLAATPASPQHDVIDMLIAEGVL